MHVALELDDHALRRQRAAREVRGAYGLTAAALEARVEVEPALPRELLELRDAERFGLLDVLDRRDRPARPELRKEDVQRRRQEMDEVRERHDRDEGERQRRVEEPRRQVEPPEGARRQ